MKYYEFIEPGLVYGLVLGRGGSKGLPGKNTRLLGGYPLVSWAVAAGLVAGLARVICSTDDSKILRAAVNAGADAPFMRPAEFSTDHATDLDVFIHALRWLAENEGRLPEFVVQLRPTTPFRDPSWIREGVKLLAGDPTATSIRSVTPTPITPYKMWKRVPDDDALHPFATPPNLKEAYNLPRAELPEVLWHTGQIDVIRTVALLSGSMTGMRILPLLTPPEFAVDIDTLADFQFAEVRFEDAMPGDLKAYMGGRCEFFT